jgi:hypothetical protein
LIAFLEAKLEADKKEKVRREREEEERILQLK